MAINHNQAIYIPKGEHDDPHELPQQQDLEGSTKIENTLYSHTDTITSTPNSSKNDYIYQHFQDNEKYINLIPTFLALKLIIPYTHILTMILSMVYLKMSLIVII